MSAVKKILLSHILLLTLVLYLCTVNLPKNTSAGESTGAEGRSVVFMGERITAPGSYPNVPDLYSPVLDDLYLYSEVSYKHETLNYEGRITTENMHECDRIHAEIRKRGHFPYSGIEMTGGYALIDLDGDDRCELLILDDPSRFAFSKQIPAICSIFTIRNGQLVCIDSGSSELNMSTILSADGIFYQCVDWHGAGYVNLKAFHLESGMSEFTTVLEARASLSFSDGDVPIPYWLKTEDGKEVNIAEEEFEVLYEQYKNPKELMALNFIPLHPGRVDPWSVPRPGEKLPVALIEYPKSYQAAPVEYKPVLDALFLLRENIVQEYDPGEELGTVGFNEYPSSSAMLGYALVDLNNDGIFELLLGYVDGLNDSAPMSIFTLKDGKPVLLKSFWRRSRGEVSVDGIIYNVGSSGAAHTSLSSYRLDKNAAVLTQLTHIFSDFSSAESKAYFVRVVDGKNHYITQREFGELRIKYIDPPEKMALKVYPITD